MIYINIYDIYIYIKPDAIFDWFNQTDLHISLPEKFPHIPQSLAINTQRCFTTCSWNYYEVQKGAECNSFTHYSCHIIFIRRGHSASRPTPNDKQIRDRSASMLTSAHS